MKTIVMTGATSGIGLETAYLLAGLGFRIIGVGHTPERCACAERKLRDAMPEASVSFYAADLMQRREVMRLAALLRDDLDRTGDDALYALINNAGCARARYMTTEDGFEQQFALNYLSGFLLTHELLPRLLQAGGRVIMTCSQSHRGVRVHWEDVMLCNGYNPLLAYKQSKLCQLLFARGLNGRFASPGLHAYAVDPGLVNTEIGCKAGGVVRMVWPLRRRAGVSPSVPAQIFARLCRAGVPPDGLYHDLNGAKRYSGQVTDENAGRLFALSERLCGVQFGEACA